MAIKSKGVTLYYYARDNANNEGKTGDAANHTLRIVQDGGTPAAPSNSPSEVDATNMPGLYQLALTDSEMNAISIVLHGLSSTADVEIIPVTVVTEDGRLFPNNQHKRGTVNTANTTPSTTQFAASDITEATDDHFVGRAIIFTSGNLDQQATFITDYTTNGSGEGLFTVSGLTESPADGDTFVIV